MLIVTAAILYVEPLSALVGRRGLVRQVHVVAGLLLPVPLLAAALGPWRRRFLADAAELNRWDDHDRRWLRSLGRDRNYRPGKFHAGQKLNAAFILGAISVLLLTGSIMKWYSPFPDDWRTGATFVHDWLGLAVLVVVAGHVAKALSEPAAIRGMVRGWVPAGWAGERHPRWQPQGRLGTPGASALPGHLVPHQDQGVGEEEPDGQEDDGR